MSEIIGITSGSHDASISIISDNNVIFASQAERYSKIKNDSVLNSELIYDALRQLDNRYIFNEKVNNYSLAFYEQSKLKRKRQFCCGQLLEAFTQNNSKKAFKFVSNAIIMSNNYGSINNIQRNEIRHHKSHAAQAYMSPYDKAIVLVIDSIGEWDTISFWLYDINNSDNHLMCLSNVKYPKSLGLMYSAFTKYGGFKPNEEEYIYMGLASYGKPIYTDQFMKTFFDKKGNFKVNFHTGLSKSIINKLNKWSINDPEFNQNMAATVQNVLEISILDIINVVKKYQEKYQTENMVYSGGVALNCVANTKIQKSVKNLWIYSNPGDSGCSLGAALVINNKAIKNEVYLGHNITSVFSKNYDMEYPYQLIASNLAEIPNIAIGVAVGRAEFGPRALGNRSLFADPRGINTKQIINDIKGREQFRPFAPVILEEYFEDYFETNGITSSPYMQYVYECKYPDRFPAITHIDGTSRVQTINEFQHPGLYTTLIKFKELTGCPMLLNTSLNIKGMPLINDKNDTLEFIRKTGVLVY